MTRLPAPVPGLARTLATTLWNVVVSGLRQFVWQSLKKGLIDVRPLSRPMRLLTVGGLTVIFGYVVSILFNDGLRQATALQPLTVESSGTRGLFVPGVAIPLTLISMTLAWSFVLAGALHVQARLRWFVLLLYLVFGYAGMAGAALSLPIAGLGLLPAALVFVLALVVLLAAFVRLPQRRWPVEAEFSLMLATQTVLIAVALAQAVSLQQRTGVQYLGGFVVSGMVDLARALIIPFVMFTGSEMANFARDVAGWGVKSVRRYAAAALWPGLLFAFLLYRWLNVAQRLAKGGLGWAQVWPWLGAMLLLAGVVTLYLWRRRQPAGESVSPGVLAALVLAATLFQVILAPLSALLALAFVISGSAAVLAGQAQGQTILAQMNAAVAALTSLSAAYRDQFELVVAALGLSVAWLARRRARPSLATFGLILAWSQLLAWLTQPGRILQGVHYQYADVDVVLLAALSVLALWQWRRRQTRPAQTEDNAWALWLLALAFLSALLTQPGFLANRFSPFLSFAGVFFLVFGIIWGALTAGGRFANSGSSAYPRESRLLLFIGYMLLSATISHWFIMSHNVENQALQSDLGLRGFETFGFALAYLILAEAGRPLLEA